MSKLVFSHFTFCCISYGSCALAGKRGTKVGRNPKNFIYSHLKVTLTLFSEALAVLLWGGGLKVQIEDLGRSVWCFIYLFTNNPKSHSDNRLLSFQINFNYIQVKIQLFAFQFPFSKSSLLNLLSYAVTHLPRQKVSCSKQLDTFVTWIG